MKAPFPWFGGKSRAAHLVWEALGDVANYVEPFAGSLAVLLGRPTPPRIETVNDADCVGPDTRILRADLTWARAADVQVGDRLVGFDEHNGPARPGLRAPTRYRRLAHATVTAVRLLTKPSYRLTFSDGTTVIASANHLWLGGSHVSGGRGWRWVRTAGLVCNRATQRSWVLKVADVVEREESWEAGWLSGLIDGEGSLKAGPGLRVTIAQNEGPVLDHAERAARARGIECTRTGRRRCRYLLLGGGMASTLSLLMRLRPERLIAKLPDRLAGISLYGRSHRAVGLVAKEFLGDQPVVAIETDCHTFIAEGLASHNCHVANFWRALAHDPEGVARHADWPVNEVDLHARHAWLVGRAEFRERMASDPDHYDARIAGWWVWGLSAWIGSGWCDANGKPSRQLPLLSAAGRGVHRTKLPNVDGSGGKGVCGVTYPTGDGLVREFQALAARLRRVRVCCGDWTRVVTDSVTRSSGVCGVLLDPPYADTEGDGLYANDTAGLSAAVRAWAVEHGDDPAMRIVLCGYEGEHAMPKGWRVVEWKAKGGYGNQGDDNDNRHRERLWLSPHCLGARQPSLFGGV